MKKITRREFIKDMSLGLTSLTLGSNALRPPQSQKDSLTKPNLLFIMTDQQSYNTMSRAGNKVLHTPNLDRLASEGVYFENAYTYCPVCVPSRAVILTGHSTESLGVRQNKDYDSPDVADVPTFDNIMSKHGWHTEYYGKWHTPYKFASTYNNYVRQGGRYTPKGGVSQRAAYLKYLDEVSHRRPAEEGELIDPYSNRPYKPDPIDWRYDQQDDYREAGSYGNLYIPFDRTRTAFIVEETIKALEQIKKNPKRVPFSLTCSIGPPHPPTIVPEPYYGMYPPQDCDPPISIDDSMDNSPYTKRASLEEMQRYKNKDLVPYMISDYYGMVKEVDYWVGKLLDKLEELDFADNTLVIFTSDHGEMLGAHGMYSKFVFYEESAHIPLIIRFPKSISSGAVVANPVSHIDLFATILDYFGINRYESEGHSLRPLIEGRNYTGIDFCVSEWPSSSMPNFMVRTPEWKFMFANSPESEALDALYNLKDDPHEMNNLIGNNPNRGNFYAQAKEMKERLVTWLKSTNSPRLQGVIDRQVINDEPPAVSIVAPKNDSIVSKLVTVSAKATNEIGIKNLEFLLNDKLQKRVPTSPYDWLWDTSKFPNGSYTIKVKARDIIDQTGEDIINTTVSNPKKKQKVIKVIR